MTWAVVVPTVGRPSLGRLLESLRAQELPDALGPPGEVVVVDDRPLPAQPDRGRDLEPLDPLDVPPTVRVVRSGGRGPAAARNAGWRSVDAAWVVFLDDDVVLPAGWGAALAADLAAAGPTTGGVQARLVVPLPRHRRPTDWERSTAGLEGAAWATADMAYRHAALAAVDGFDERFPRAYREDADLAVRVRRAGWSLARGGRVTVHPVRPARPAVSVRVQAGNADDALLRALHGRRWRDVAETGRGRGSRHLVTVAAAGTAAVWALRGRRAALLPAAAWAALSAELLWRRVAPGPRPGEAGWAREWARMAWTSLLIPPVAVAHRVRGTLRHARRAAPWRPPLRAVLFDRDGTLVHDVPYAVDPEAVEPVAGARAVLDALRGAGVAVGVVSNQSGVARGLQTRAQVDAVNARVEELLGPFATVRVCPHGPDDGCPCRKPEPGLVLAAARDLGVEPWRCAVVGDIGADVRAAVAAGAVPVLVPTPATRADEIAHALSTARVTGDLVSALEVLRPLLAGAPR